MAFETRAAMDEGQNIYGDCLVYIRRHWEKLTFYHPRDKGKHLGLPHRFVAPSGGIFKNDQFYWDSYFTILGLVKSGKVKLARGMVDNLISLFERFGIVPMRNRYYNLGTSQIPFLSSMIFEVFDYNQDKVWLEKSMAAAGEELKKYWMNENLTEKHVVYKGLSRYCDHYITHLGAEHESGWDMTSRFNDRCLDYLPVDLNACLYKYEKDLEKANLLLDKPAKARKFKKQAERRKENMNTLMWSEKEHFFYDYNYHLQERSHFMSVAGFYPLWAQMATAEQAEAIRAHILPQFEYAGGIANTQPTGLSPDRKQHDYPNGWPNQQWIVIKGLLNYGFTEDARRITQKWMDMNLRIFRETGKFWEKHNVVEASTAVFNSDRYFLQSGFGWTNAVFVRLAHEFGWAR